MPPVCCRRIRAMMSDQQELLQRETMGIQSDAFGQAFKTKALRALLKRSKAPITSALAARHVIISIDPSGGGSSHFALVSCYYENGMMVVCGLESIPAKNPADYENGIRNHCCRLRQLPKFKSALFVVCPEANLGFERYVSPCFCQRWPGCSLRLPSAVPTSRESSKPSSTRWSCTKQSQGCLACTPLIKAKSACVAS